MAEQILKLSPHRDLQCYFFTPSAIAALSQADANGFTLSGKWRQQFDWAVVEWNRDNVFEHPSLRYLPDGDLSGLTLSYVEQRSNCIPVESNLYPTVSWNKLRIWASDATGIESVYYVDLASKATPIAGTYVPASATMILVASPDVGKRVGLAFLENHYYYIVQAGDSLSTIAAGIAADINQSLSFKASSSGPSVTVSWAATDPAAPYHKLLGANGNRIGIYGFAEEQTPVWQNATGLFAGGTFPSAYRIDLDFSQLTGTTDSVSSLQPVPTSSVRKLRWTWGADLQAASFVQTEFQVTVSNWTVAGNNRVYNVAGPGSRRIEDTDPSVVYGSAWELQSGNYSGGSTHVATKQGLYCTVAYNAQGQHEVYLGTRMLSPGSIISVSVDSGAARYISLDQQEDVSVSFSLGTWAKGPHTVVLTNLGNLTYSGPSTPAFYFDFLDVVYASGSIRIEDTDPSVVYSDGWDLQSGNYSGSRIHAAIVTGVDCTIAYSEAAQHELYLGTRMLSPGSLVSVSIDGVARTLSLDQPGEDVLIRVSLGTLAAGPHTVILTNLGNPKYPVTQYPNSTYVSPAFYFDFLEVVYPSANLPNVDVQPQLALATDWDTYHAQSLPAERTAWMVNKLGFAGRLNHYTGALWFYELVRTGTVYASAVLTLTLDANAANKTVILNVGTAGQPQTGISHLILADDSAPTVAIALTNSINLGSNLLWASANGNQITLTARAMGSLGNSVVAGLDTASAGCQISPTSVTLANGSDGASYNNLDPRDPTNVSLIAAAANWRTDLTATPRINRAARDWHQAYFTALRSYGIDAVAAFSTELLNGDPSDAVGIAQKYSDGTAVTVNTPAVQTNFSPVSLSFWTQVYLDMATLQSNAGMVPYLQAGEVQWWYFPKSGVSMPFYDAYTEQQFQALYGRAMQVIVASDIDGNEDLGPYADEIAFLPTLIGAYTRAIRTALVGSFPNCRFEVLYPTDTNDTLLNRLINFPANDWTPQNLTCLKTESFTFTSNRDLDKSSYSMSVSALQGFTGRQRSHLIGIGDAWTAWVKEMDIAQSEGLESVVLFALDQFCLIGYKNPPKNQANRSRRLG